MVVSSGRYQPFYYVLSVDETVPVVHQWNHGLRARMITTQSHYDEYDGQHAAASESRTFTFTVGTGTDAERQLLSPYRKTTSLDIRATAAATTVDDINFANRRRLLVQSTDLGLDCILKAG